jgi:multiple sugar transport system substrate-binding protein
VAVLGLAAACSGGGSGATSGKVNLTYALWDPHEEIGYKQSISVFEQHHPNIHVTIEQIPYTNYEAKLTEEFTSGQGPDVYWVNTPFLATWIKDGVMENIAPKIKAAHINMAQYYPSLVALHTHDGAIYGLPKDWDTIAFYYNKTYFAQHHLTPPTSWSWNLSNGGSFVHFLQEATIDTSGHNALSPSFNASSVKTYGTDMPNSMQGGFGNFWAENGVRVIAKPYASTTSFDTPAGIATTQFLQNLMYKWHVAAPGSELGSNATNPSSQDISLFARGTVASIIEGDWTTVPITQSVKFKVGVIPMPAGPDGTWSVFNGLIDAINTHSPNQQAAWELEQWLGSPASEKILGSGGYVWPGIRSLDPLFVAHWAKAGINMQPFLNEAHGNTVTWPVAPGMNQALTDMGRDMGPIYLGHGQVSGSLATAAKDANNDLNSGGA